MSENEYKKRAKPNVNSAGEKELDKIAKQSDDFSNQIKDLTLDRMNAAPKAEQEPQTKLSSEDIRKSKEIHLKPKRTISSREPFNEKYRKDWNFAKEMVHFIAENHEIIGEHIEPWTKPFAGIPAEQWDVPTNTPVWGPRYLAERIKGCAYHRFKSEQATPTGEDGMAQYRGAIVVDTVIQRLDARPVTNERKSIFMGAANF